MKKGRIFIPPFSVFCKYTRHSEFISGSDFRCDEILKRAQENIDLILFPLNFGPGIFQLNSAVENEFF